MQITVEPVEPRQARLTLVVPPERMERALHEVAQKVAGRQRFAGYRPGKVPVRLVAARVGEEALQQAAEEHLTEQVVRQGLKEKDIEPFASPAVEIVSRDPLTLSVLVPLPPEVELGDYANRLRVERPPAASVDEGDVDARLAEWRRELATLQTVDRPAAAGDTIYLSLVGRDGDRVVFEEESLALALTPEGADAARLPRELVDALVGVAAGESRRFAVTYSAFWSEPELREREVGFEAVVASVSGMVEPAVDEALVRELAGVASVDDLRARIRQQLVARAQLAANDAFVTSLVDALVAASRVSYPPVLLDNEVAREVAGLRVRVERQGFTWQRWLELQNTDEESLWAEVEPQVTARLKRRLVLGAFVEAEGIEVSKAEIDAEVDHIFESASPPERRKLGRDEDLRRGAGSRLLSSRTIERLVEIAARVAAAEDGGTAGQVEGEAPAPDAAAATSVAPEARSS